MKKRTIAIVGGAILLVGGVVWAWPCADAQVERVVELMNDDTLSHRQRWEKMHEEMPKLSDQQREAVFDKMSEHWEHRGQKAIEGYFALPPAQRKAYLDKQIQEDEKRHKEHQAHRPPAGQQQRQRQAGGPPAGRQNRTPQQSMAQRNKRLDRSTPEHRAQRSAYFAAMQKRRIELGLPAWGGPGHGHGR
jgi:hypothetical protein